jgi:hypothetical protein
MPKPTIPTLGRKTVSAHEIEKLILDPMRAVPMLEKVSVEVARLPKPTRDGCNWTAKHSPLPVGCPPESERLLYDIIENARRNFNLWESH